MPKVTEDFVESASPAMREIAGGLSIRSHVSSTPKVRHARSHAFERSERDNLFMYHKSKIGSILEDELGGRPFGIRTVWQAGDIAS